MVYFLTYHSDDKAIKTAVLTVLEERDCRDVTEFAVTIGNPLESETHDHGRFVCVAHPRGVYMSECREIESALHRLEARVPARRAAFKPLELAVRP